MPIIEEKAAAEAKAKRAEEMYRREKDSLDQAVIAHDRELDEMETRLLQTKEAAAEVKNISKNNLHIYLIISLFSHECSR